MGYPYVSTFVPPTLLSYGFVSSTGGNNNVHEIRALDIAVPSSVSKVPVATSVVVSTPEDTPISIVLSDYAYDENGNSTLNWTSGLDLDLSNGGIQSSKTTAQGTFTSQGNGTVLFTPTSNYNGGPISIGYTIADFGNASPNITPQTSNSANITVTVLPVNDPPTTLSSSVTVNGDQLYTFVPASFPFTDAVEGHLLEAVQIEAVPALGTLHVNGATVTAGQFITAASMTLANLTYTAPANANGAPYTSFSYRVRDNGGTANGGVNLSAVSGTMNINVSGGRNTAPTTVSSSVTLNEDQIYTFTPSSFPLNDAEGNVLDAVQFVTLPTSGALYLGAATVTAGQFVTAANMNTASLRYTAPANHNGSPYATFNFRVRDNGGTANAGTDLSSSASMTIHIYPVNDPPMTSSRNVTVSGSQSYTFVPPDFPFTDAVESHMFDAVQIITVPASGTLRLGAATVTAGQFITTASLTQIGLTYTSPANANGTPYTTFTFRVRDNGGTANGGVDISTAAVMNINVAGSESTAPTTISSSVTTFEDTSFTFTPVNFPFTDAPENNTLTAVIVTPPLSGTLTLNGFALTSSATVPAAMVSSLVYTPIPNATGISSFAFQVQDNGSGANISAPATMTINILPVNDPPVATPLVNISPEDYPLYFTVEAFRFTDIDDGAFSAVEFTTLPSKGTFFYGATPVAVGSLLTKAQLQTGELRYVPLLNENGSLYTTFTFRVRDDGGTANGGIDLSVAAATATLSISPVNDPPSGTDHTVSIAKNSTYTFTVADFPFTDPFDSPANTLLAVKVSTLPATGSLTLSGSPVSASQVINAASITAGNLKYTPVTNQAGSPYAGFNFQVQDNGGVSYGGIDLDPSPNTLTINVNDSGTAPAISSFVPATGPIGTLVNIQGAHLSGLTSLTIGGTEAIIVSKNDSTVVGMVMPGAVNGGISIVTSGGSVTASGMFIVSPTLYPNTPSEHALQAAGMGGHSVSISADGTALITNTDGGGKVWIYQFNGTSWITEANGIGLPGATGEGMHMSSALSLDGNTAIVGNHADDNNKGAVWILSRANGVWSPQASKLVGSAAIGESRQGWSVSLSADGNTAAVGGFGDNFDGNFAKGAIWIYTRLNGIWTQSGNKLTVSGTSLGNAISLSADGKTLLAGASSDETATGTAWVFVKSENSWVQQAKLVGSDKIGNSYQGSSVSLSADGNTAIIGGEGDNNSQGAAWVFARNGQTWSQQGQKLVGTAGIGQGRQGVQADLSADGNTIVIGGSGDNSNQGAIWIFTRNDNAWTQKGNKIVLNAINGSNSTGRAIDLTPDGRTLIIGGSASVGASALFFTYDSLSTPILTKPGVFGTGRISALAQSTIQNSNTGPITGRGYIYFESAAPAIFSKIIAGPDGPMPVGVLSSLKPATNYTVKSYAESNSQTYYSEETTFTTQALFPYTASLSNPAEEGITLGGDPNPAKLTAAYTDAPGAGYLMLTNNANNQKGFARSLVKFPSAQGLSFSFDYYTYGGNGADGLTFFLYDASTALFNIGGFGGSLGYAQNNSTPGVSKGFLGVGIDEFGNFSNPGAGRQGGPGQRASSLTLRGDGNGNHNDPKNYEYLTSIQTTDATAMSTAGGGNPFGIAGGVNGRTGGGLTASVAGYRRARVDLVPNGLGTGFKVNAWITEGTSGGGIIHHLIKDYQYLPDDSIPEFLSYGFSAGTGGLNNYHEVRNLEIKIPENVSSAPTVADISKSGNENTTVSFFSSDFSLKFTSPQSLPLVKVKIVNLPANGVLKLNGTNITTGQEIPATDLLNITFVPNQFYHGIDNFQWNGSDGMLYAVSGAYVNLNISAAPIFPYSESFKNSTAAGLVFGGSPNTASLTSGNVDASGAGYLRLTTNSTNQKGFARNTKSFPSGDGLSISFDYYTYGGTGADGVSFFLYDITASPFVIGGFGGSLGYAQNNTAPGVSKAYLGIGFDEFGNFSQAGAGRQGGAGQRPSSVSLRGDGDGNSEVPTNYEYLTSMQTTNSSEMTAAGAGSAFQVAGGIDGRTAGTQGLSAINAGYRNAQIELKPNGLGTGFILNVWVTEGATAGGIAHHVVKNYSYSGSNVPANLGYGFAGSTGGSTNFHEIRNLNISLPAPVISDVVKNGNENSTVIFTAADFNSKFNSLSASPLVKVKILSLPVSGTLKLNSVNVVANQEIPAASLGDLTYLAVSGSAGNQSFAWNGSDGTSYALTPATVQLTISATSVFPYHESFKNSVAADMIYGGAAAQLTAGTIDNQGEGYLRLTNNTNNQTGFVRNTKAFPSNNGFLIDFEYYTYGGTGADGIVFYLYDATANPFNIGSYGGSLGYAQRSDINGSGVSKGFLGIGIDEFGNFGTTLQGRVGGYTNSPGGRTPSMITLRGDGNGTGTIQVGTAIPNSNYEYLTSIQTTNAAAMALAGAGTPFNIAGGIQLSGSTMPTRAAGLSPAHNGYRKARIELVPNGTNFIVNVWITEGNTSGAITHQVVKDYVYAPTGAIPALLSYGFSGSTGGSTNYHEIRNLNINESQSFVAPVVMTLKDMAFGGRALQTGGSITAATTELDPTNLITPNQDGKNDVWFIRNIELYPKNSVRIYSRMGKLVYSKNNYNNDWNGTEKGTDLPVGTYYYVLDPGNGKPLIKGYVSIVR